MKIKDKFEIDDWVIVVVFFIISLTLTCIFGK